MAAFGSLAQVEVWTLPHHSATGKDWTSAILVIAAGRQPLVSLVPGGVDHEIMRGRSDQGTVSGEGYPATTVGGPILIGPQPLFEVL